MPLPGNHHDGSKYKNPWASGLSLRRFTSAILSGPLTRAQPFNVPIEPVKTVPCDFGLYLSEYTTKGICATWLGHAGFLLQLPGRTRVLFDPIFAERASPSTWIGPRRWLPAPCKASDLPPVDYIVISHNHYDHLDLEALRDVIKSSPEVQFLVPKGVRSVLDEHFSQTIVNVLELDWWDKVSFPTSEGGRTEFVCTPAQHNSGRGILDQNSTLWSSWVVRSFSPSSDIPSSSVYHAGDTGYTTPSGPCPAFADIGSQYGPFDLALIPIWRGASLSILGKAGYRLTPRTTEAFLSELHASPPDAISLSRDVRAQHTLGMHFGTFCGSEDESKEPLVQLVEALSNGRDQNIDLRTFWKEEGGFGVIDVGETVLLALH